MELKDLMQGGDSRSKDFLEKIRGYNNVLAFASLGAHVDNSLSRGRGIYTFKVHGSIYHNIGPMMPGGVADQAPRFAQLYFYDTDHELQNRLHHVPELDVDVLRTLQSMMHRTNPYAQAFRSAAATMQDNCISEMRMIIVETRANGWHYLAPRASEVAVIMPGQGDESNIGHRDIVVNYCNGGLKRISNLHRSYMPLVYVLLFPNGEDRWHPYIPLLRLHRTNDDEYGNPHVNNVGKHVS